MAFQSTKVQKKSNTERQNTSLQHPGVRKTTLTPMHKPTSSSINTQTRSYTHPPLIGAYTPTTFPNKLFQWTAKVM
jgi:hypothetical protein